MSTAEAVTTTDADEIKQWVEERGGVTGQGKNRRQRRQRHFTH